MIMIIYIMAYRVEYTLAYTNPLFWFYDEPITGKPLEEHASDLKRSDMTPSPTVADKSLDSGSEMSREKFDLLYYPLEEQLVPQQVTGQVSNDESLRHTLNRSPFNSNGEIVMVRCLASSPDLACIYCNIVNVGVTPDASNRRR